jgi:hypothetical protein
MGVCAKSHVNGIVRRVASAALALAVLVGCTAGTVLRPSRSQAELIEARTAEETQAAEFRLRIAQRGVARVKANYDAYAAGRAAAPPVIDLLVISGGGDWGAFGAGVLKGWGRVSGPLARPDFDVVTGVSTGALIAPFAFLGDDKSIDQIVDLYRNPRKDWFQPRSLLSFITGGASYGDIPGLEKDIHRTLDETMLRRLVEAGKDGRVLAVNTSNLDFGEMHVWDLVAEARRALETGQADRVHRILLASSAIPGAFPPREIDGGLYADGALTGNILYGGRTTLKDNATAIWQRLYPDIPMPKARYWIIFNNQVRPPPDVVQPRWTSVLTRSVDTSSRSATPNGLRHLFALSDVTKYRFGAEVEVRYIAVPDDWTPPKPDMFDQEVMNALAGMGERIGADPANWQTDPP